MKNWPTRQTLNQTGRGGQGKITGRGKLLRDKKVRMRALKGSYLRNTTTGGTDRTEKFIHFRTRVEMRNTEQADRGKEKIIFLSHRGLTKESIILMEDKLEK